MLPLRNCNNIGDLRLRARSKLPSPMFHYIDGVPAPIDTLMPIRDAVGDKLELILGGGIRRGTHIVNALVMGANACSIGRPFLCGLAAGGQAGVARGIEILKSEVERDLALLGCSSIAELRPDHISQLNMKMP
ncbi:alpha-hydroxy-acid oxidizing protein [Zhongshania sp. BJYM1]|uniref:alpha-hydroxy-acid oxidizing protein n=1 Tax=Zhongshania aquatica TaxID=2965069 RepID=UPI0022B3A43C|nr:alpha-hydroxy-acid oxidizing protein [Marortus sp. BJYM1]